jgi:hypothetical protein
MKEHVMQETDLTLDIQKLISWQQSFSNDSNPIKNW